MKNLSSGRYYQRYVEKKIIGKGSFGSATLVECLEDNKIYVAKKILLGKLKEKEQEQSLLEVKLFFYFFYHHLVSYHSSPLK